MGMSYLFGMRPQTALAFSLALLPSTTALAHSAGLEGTQWRTASGSGIVRFERCEGARLCGSIVRVLTPGQAGATDANNPDPALRSRPVQGLRILSGFTASGHGVWTGGRIYNPEDGRSYRSELRIGRDGRLQVKGCVGPVCQTQHWTQAR
jgi:uncharacterized protein (DUF2147 family)